jgi:hypothetical protein
VLLLHLLPIPARPYLHWIGGLSNHFRSRVECTRVLIPICCLLFMSQSLSLFFSDPATSFIAVFICGSDRTQMLDLSVTVWLLSEVTSAPPEERRLEPGAPSKPAKREGHKAGPQSRAAKGKPAWFY